MLDDILKAARQQISERLTSPLLGSFAVAWGIWNYKFLVILFSSNTVSQTFQMVDRVAFPDLTSVALKGILLPGLTAAAYIFLYPYPARFVYGFSLRRQRETNALRQQIENETLLSVEESRRIRTEFVAVEARQREEMDRLNVEIGRLRSELGTVVKEPHNAVLKSVPTATYPKVSSSQMLLLMLIERGGGKVTQDGIISTSKESKVKTEFDLGELEQMKLLHKNYDQSERDYTYEFTHEGRRLVVETADPVPNSKLEGGA